MSIRRQSCDVCFKARRKCDLTYPVCERCQKGNKSCHYAYPPQNLTKDDRSFALVTTAVRQDMGTVSSDWISYAGQFRQIYEQQRPIPSNLGSLGEAAPAAVTTEWSWVFEEIKAYPLTFAKQAETIFIHKALYDNAYPRPLRAAFGICSACVSINDRNRSVVFQALGEEISELLTPAATSTLLENLARYQAAVLYQIIRLFWGDIEQRTVAERQELFVRSYGLRLLRRADTEMRYSQPTWENWLLAESVRRTVLIAFKLYTMHAHIRYGICTEAEAMSILPVSAKSGSWSSRDAYFLHETGQDQVTYEHFTSQWAAAPRVVHEPFEKLLLVGYKGAGHFAALMEQTKIRE